MDKLPAIAGKLFSREVVKKVENRNEGALGTLINQPSAKSSLIYTVQQNAPEKMAVAQSFYH